MKNFFIFLLGFIFGVVALLCIGYVGQIQDDVVMFDQPGDSIDIEHNKVVVIQVFDDGSALAHNFSTVVRLAEKEGVHYYDNQIVEAPKGYCWRKIGIYKYVSKDGDYKTVPIVDVFKK